MSEGVEVIIIGGGVVGLCAAIAMQQLGFSATLLDSGSLNVDTSPAISRVYAINKSSETLFKQLGVWDLLDKSAMSLYSHMHVWDAKNNAHIDFDARMIGADRLGFMIEESVIKRALLQLATTLNIRLIPGCKINAINQVADDITVMNGAQSWSGKLLIVADGANSAIRDLLNVPITTWPYHQHAIVATVQTEKPHQRTAYQVFHPDGPLAFLPMADPHQSSIVWSTTRTEQLMLLSDELFEFELTNAFAATLGNIRLLTKRYQFPLHMRHVQRYSGACWLLMGDAAHTIHPLAGLGLNVGLADLTTWLALIKNNKRFMWSKRNLSSYQRHRKHALWQTIAVMEGLHVLFTNPFPPIVTLRGLGLNICNRLSPIKRLLIEYAAGVHAVV
ncbi:MAG: FAD-dependent monooxygenase [Legionellaceae bacterium]|nr:FAD-dependent monooxygenase [Legionellaceae bacterium]